jgi:hypothetical protein
MNPPDWVGWPGRKDYEYPAEYGGVTTLREDQFSPTQSVLATTNARPKKRDAGEAGLVEKK